MFGTNYTSIWETIQIQSWNPEDIPDAPPELNILTTWKKSTQRHLSVSPTPQPLKLMLHFLEVPPFRVLEVKFRWSIQG
jgi:hypothetical protein